MLAGTPLFRLFNLQNLDSKGLQMILKQAADRNRSSHLAHFLGIMHPFLQRQNIQYTIVAVNQTGEYSLLFILLQSLGALESLKRREVEMPHISQHPFNCPRPSSHILHAPYCFKPILIIFQQIMLTLLLG
jgi:hypothetical protein